MLITILSVFIFIFHDDVQSLLPISIHESDFLVLHTIIELFSVVVAFVIFLQPWLSYWHGQVRYHLVLGMIFFAVGSFDLVHTFLYKGMPLLNDPYSVTRATWLWICARLTESIGLGLAFIDMKSRRVLNPILPFAVVATLTFLTIGYIVLVPESLPLLVVEGEGVTPLKYSAEYFISFVHFIALSIIFTKYTKERNGDMLLLVMAIILILFSELVFTLYKNVFDFDNLLGHLYKFIGYYFIYRSIFYPQMKEYLLKRREERRIIELKLRKMYDSSRDKGTCPLFRQWDLGAFLHAPVHLRSESFKQQAVHSHSQEDFRQNSGGARHH